MDLWPRILEMLVTPPGVIILLLLLSFIAYLKWNWLGAAVLALSTVALVVSSLPLTAHRLIAELESFAKPVDLVPLAESGPKASIYVPRKSEKNPPEAIVVLGHGRYAEAPEYNFEDTASALGLVRLRYAAHLQRKTGVPILVSGGKPGGERRAEAEIMKDVLTEELRASVKWIETESRNTAENARLSAALLRDARIRHVYLVTHAWHMRRAARHFETAGIHVTPAPTGFLTMTRKERELSAYLPSARGQLLVYQALHERLAFSWHELFGDSTTTAGRSSLPVDVPAK